MRQPLDQAMFAPYRHHVVEVDDDEDEDLLQFVAASNAFIRDGLAGGGGVLVHWCVPRPSFPFQQSGLGSPSWRRQQAAALGRAAALAPAPGPMPSPTPSPTDASADASTDLHPISAMGKSRSASLVIAYLMSQDPSLTPAAALDLVRLSRPIAEPNRGFMAQLHLYHSMGCPADVVGQAPYQRWLYQQQVRASIACGRAPDSIRFEDEAGSGVAGEPDLDAGPDAPVREYRCRRCRRSLATSAHLAPHSPKPARGGTHAKPSPGRGPIASLEPADPAPAPAPAPAPPDPCAHVFLDPLSWMRSELEQGKLEGRLECPNARCAAQVGKYAWQGMQCSCGAWVVPSISLTRDRVDEVRARPRPGPGLGGGKM
jgi:dual specificity phosphatase 12